MPSFFALAPVGPPPERTLPYAVISATNLNGVYVGTDTYARFRTMKPDTVIAHTLLVYRIVDGTAN